MFLADVRRVWKNARLYNREDTIYYKYANLLEAMVDTHVAAHVLAP
jgi:histone acetyltransferase